MGVCHDPYSLVGSTRTNICVLGKCNRDFSILDDYIYELEINIVPLHMCGVIFTYPYMCLWDAKIPWGYLKWFDFPC